MSNPKIDHVVPSFKVGVVHNFRIVGSGFSLDDGEGGVGTVTVELADANNVFTWTPASSAATLIDDKNLQVRAKAARAKPAHAKGAHARHKTDVEGAAGSGDLTITVTNGDGSATPPTSTSVTYDESPDT